MLSAPIGIKNSANVREAREVRHRQYIATALTTGILRLATCQLPLAACFFFFSTAVSADEPVPEARGVWMSRDVIRAGPTRMEQVFRSLAQGHLNRVFINTWYQGGTIYPSDVVARVGGLRQLSEFVGRDPMREAIDIAHRLGLEVIAWMEYGLMIHYSGGDTLNSGPIVAQHPDWEAIDRKGRHYVYSEGGYFHWLDPAHPDVVQFMEDLHGELATKYPDLDGMQMDRIRYPSLEFSYSDTARARYMREKAGTDPMHIDQNHPEWWRWVKWREQQTTNVARRIYRRVKSTNPSILVSAAVVPPYMLVGSSKMQDWPTWADSGYVDVLEPMLYLDNADFPYQLTEAFRAAPQDFYLYPGLALVDNAGRYRGDATAEFQITETRQRGGKGVAIWDYRALSPSTLSFLKDRLFVTPTTLPHNDIIVDDGSVTRFQAVGGWTLVSDGYRGTSVAASSGDGSQRAVWQPKLLRAGRYEIYARWIADSSNASNARYEITLGSQTRVKTVDQRENGGRWVFLTADSIPYGAPTSVQLTNQADGRVVADAVRYVIGKKFTLLDFNVPDSLHVDLKFSRALQRESAEEVSHYTINQGVSVLSAAVDVQDPAGVRLTTTPLQRDVWYTLTLNGVQDEVENVLSSLQIRFRYAPALTQLMVDNRDQNFRTFGQWTASTADPGFIGSDYLISSAGFGENRAQWWCFVLVDGYYEVSAFWPGGRGRAAKVPYFVLHKEGTDTVWMDQRVNGGQWNVLGIFRYVGGQAASVMVTNAVAEGTVIADAVRLRRVLATTVTTQLPETNPSAFRLHQNFPNPFNPTTAIDYELERGGHVSLKVYNLQGQEVVTLTEGTLAAGRHRVIFHAGALGSGIYVYQLRYRPRGLAQTRMQTRKMVVLR
ncbi:MAG: golvesin C-terminal-like domain-containing protein [Candidatus Oleimicrobiaceae bacterium]